MASNKNKHKNSNKELPQNPSRRNLLKGAGIVSAAVAGSGAATNIIAAESSSNAATQPRVREALETLTAAEAETLDALVDRIIPSDDSGPGAREARAVHYIDRSLASDNQGSRANYAMGLTAINDFARAEQGKPFHQLSTQLQDEVITAVIEGDVSGFNPSGAGFFGMVRSHTIQGTFSDPYYGGNRDFIGWDMIGYPGVRIGVSESEVAQGRALAPNHQSAYDIPTFTKVVSVTGGNRNGR